MGTTDGNGVYTPDLDEQGWDPEFATNLDLFSQNITDHAAHLADTSDAHDASAISFSPTGTVAATDVQAAIAEVASEAAAAGAPGTADYLVGTTQAGLSAEIVVGATPNGELGGTWGAITVDASHGGGTHAATQAAAEATAASAAATHAGAADPHTGYQKESEKAAASGYASLDGSTKVPIAQVPTGTSSSTVALGDAAAALDATHAGAADPHTGYVLESLLDAKGDLYVASAADSPARLAVGTDFVDELIPDASATAGVRWGFRRDPLRPSGAIAETFPRGTALTSNIPGAGTSGTVLLDAIGLASGVTITSITYVTGATALATGTHQIFGLYDLSLNLLRGTSDDTSTAWGANTAKTLNLTSTYLTTTSGLFYLGVLITATTMPNLAGILKVGTAIDGIAPNLHGLSSTSQTSLPSPAGAITAGASYRYAYVS